MSQSTPDPVTGSNDPFRPDDDERDENRPENEIGIEFPVLGSNEQVRDVDRDEPGDHV